MTRVGNKEVLGAGVPKEKTKGFVQENITFLFQWRGCYVILKSVLLIASSENDSSLGQLPCSGKDQIIYPFLDFISGKIASFLLV
jgi:hypothetical protein